MIFDAIALMIERWAPDLVPRVDSAMLIHLPIVPHRVLSREMSPTEALRLMVEFSLPSRAVAIEDQASCVVLMDENPGATGICSPRAFVDGVPAAMDTRFDVYSEGDLARLTADARARNPPGTMIISTGTVHPQVISTTGYRVEGNLTRVIYGTVDALKEAPGTRASPTHPKYDRLLASGLRNAMTALEEITHIEAMPLFDGWPPHPMAAACTPCRIRRSHQRPVTLVGNAGDLDVRGPTAAE